MLRWIAFGRWTEAVRCFPVEEWLEERKETVRLESKRVCSEVSPPDCGTSSCTASIYGYKNIQLIQRARKIGLHIQNSSRQRLTIDWTIFMRWRRIRWTHLMTSTFCSFSAWWRSMSNPISVPVRPTPALSKHETSSNVSASRQAQCLQRCAPAVDEKRSWRFVFSKLLHDDCVKSEQVCCCLWGALIRPSCEVKLDKLLCQRSHLEEWTICKTIYYSKSWRQENN